MQDKKIIAISGGIGAGKSMVRNVLKALGAYTIDADEINRELMKKSSYIDKVREIFPDAVINNKIDKRILANIVFNDKESLIKLNSLAHPLITGIIMYEASMARERLIFVEIPLLIESGIYKVFDKIWYVDSPPHRRVERAVARGNINEELVGKIIALQENEKKAKELATDVIVNDGTEEQLWEKVQKLFFTL